MRIHVLSMVIWRPKVLQFLSQKYCNDHNMKVKADKVTIKMGMKLEWMALAFQGVMEHNTASHDQKWC
jgi:hypothetical protein